MESIFSEVSGNDEKFPTTTLHQAFELDLNKGGRMHFDGYNQGVLIDERKYQIAFEYDGKQHDEFPNSIHRNLVEFKDLQERDILKNNICEYPEYKTVLIRIKEILGFNFKNHQQFQGEIIKQFNDKTGIKLSNIPLFNYNESTNTMRKKMSNNEV